MAYFCYRCGNPLEKNAAECMCCGAHVRVHRERTRPTIQSYHASACVIPVGKIAVGAAAVIVLVLLALLHSGSRKSIDLNKYVDVSFSGYNGYGTASVHFDRDRFYQDNQGKIKSKNANSITRYLDPTETLLSTCIDGKLVESTQLSNGDKVVYRWSCQDEQAKELYGVSLKHLDISFKVNGLEEIESFDAFSDLSLRFSGSNGFGVAELENKAAAGSPAQKLYYSVEPSSGLSNGDTVTVSFSYGWYSGSDLANSLIRDFGMTPMQTEKQFQVNGLEELASFDPFDYIEFNLYGISGEGTIEDVVLRDNRFMENAHVYFDPRWNLSNGDTVTVTVSFGIFLDEYAMRSAMADKYGTVPAALEKTFTIDGLSYYVRDIEDLPAAAEQTMKQQLEDVVRSNVANTWGSAEHLDSLEHVGTYVLRKKDKSIYGEANYVDIVYRVNASVSIPAEGIQRTFSYYYVLSYRGVVVDQYGNFVKGSYDIVSSSKRFEPGIPGHSFWYAGYGDLQQVYNEYAAKNLAHYYVTASENLPVS